MVPLTRDYQYVKATFSDYARPADQGEGLPAFAPQTSYDDYAESVEDLLALCVTGFPDFNQKATQRRSLIFIGPGQLRTAGDPRPALFTTDRVRDLALAAGVQVNILITGPDSAALDSLARDTAGQSFSADSSAAAHVAEIRDKPPAARFSDADGALRRSTESPDVPLLIALLAAAVPGRVAAGAAAMTSQPVLPLSLLFGIAAAILVLRVVVLRRLTGAARTRVAGWRWSALTSAMLLLIMAASRPVIEPHAQSATHAAGRQAPKYSWSSTDPPTCG